MHTALSADTEMALIAQGIYSFGCKLSLLPIIAPYYRVESLYGVKGMSCGGKGEWLMERADQSAVTHVLDRAQRQKKGIPQYSKSHLHRG